MKLIIDIDDELVETARFAVRMDMGDGYVKSIANGIPLDEMKNGEVIKTIFPQTKTRGENMNFINFTLDGIVGATVEKDWWLTKYKGEIDKLDVAESEG